MLSAKDLPIKSQLQDKLDNFHTFPQFWDSDDKDGTNQTLSPEELQISQKIDKEVEEFRLLLEAIYTNRENQRRFSFDTNNFIKLRNFSIEKINTLHQQRQQTGTNNGEGHSTSAGSSSSSSSQTDSKRKKKNK